MFLFKWISQRDHEYGHTFFYRYVQWILHTNGERILDFDVTVDKVTGLRSFIHKGAVKEITPIIDSIY